MPRVTRGTKARRRRRKILKAASGYVGGRKLYRQARETVCAAFGSDGNAIDFVQGMCIVRITRDPDQIDVRLQQT